MNIRPKVAIFSPNPWNETPTFVKAHIDFIDADIFVLCGGYRPSFSVNEGLVVKGTLFAKLKRKLEELLPISDLGSHEKAIKDFLIRNKIQVVLAEFGVTGVKTVRACQAANVPMIVHFHGFDAHMYRTVRRYGRSYRKLFAYATYIIGVSNYMCKQLEDLGAPKEKLVYAPYGPNPAFFKFKPGNQSNTIISIGRFIPKKSPETTIRAFAQLSDQYPSIKLKMGGSGERLNYCKRLIQQLNISDKVELLGNINHQQVVNLMQDAMMFVQHSVIAPDGDTEGTPVSILEASAAGLPVVSTRHAGIPDVIIEGETGLLVDEHDIGAYRNAMEWIINNPEKRIEMGKKGRERIESAFTMEKHIGTLNDLIKKCLHP